MPKKKHKPAVALSLRCDECGYRWTAIFSSGVLKRVVTCHYCASFVNTNGKPLGTTFKPKCSGCGRIHRKIPCEFCAYE